MSPEVPATIGGAKVICHTLIDQRHRFTGACKQVVSGQQKGPMFGLAICQYTEGKDFYLFGCDALWRCQTDTLHLTLDEAKEQAEFEYEGTSGTWIHLS